MGSHATTREQGQTDALKQEWDMGNAHIFEVGERSCQFWATAGSPDRGRTAPGVICYDGYRRVRAMHSGDFHDVR